VDLDSSLIEGNVWKGENKRKERKKEKKVERKLRVFALTVTLSHFKFYIPIGCILINEYHSAN